MTVQDDHAVSVFRKAAQDEESPVRLIQGPATQLADPHGIAVDSNAGLLYVTNWGTVADRFYDLGVTTRGQGDGKANWPAGAKPTFRGREGISRPPLPCTARMGPAMSPHCK